MSSECCDIRNRCDQYLQIALWFFTIFNSHLTVYCYIHAQQMLLIYIILTVKPSNNKLYIYSKQAPRTFQEFPRSHTDLPHFQAWRQPYWFTLYGSFWSFFCFGPQLLLRQSNLTSFCSSPDKLHSSTWRSQRNIVVGSVGFSFRLQQQIREDHGRQTNCWNLWSASTSSFNSSHPSPSKWLQLFHCAVVRKINEPFNKA